MRRSRTSLRTAFLALECRPSTPSNGSDVKAVVAYLRTLQGTKQTVKLPGDPDRGETIFFGNAGCSGCHMIAGKGGYIASDLSGYARTHEVEQIRSAITTPAPPATGRRDW